MSASSDRETRKVNGASSAGSTGGKGVKVAAQLGEELVNKRRRARQRQIRRFCLAGIVKTVENQVGAVVVGGEKVVGSLAKKGEEGRRRARRGWVASRRHETHIPNPFL